MAGLVTEKDIINKLAEQVAEIEGIQNAYPFAENPASMQDSMMPAVVFYPRRSRHQRKGHHNVWTNTIEIRGLLFVTKRMTAAGDIKIIENRALIFPQRFRQKFQTDSVIRDLLNLGVQKADFVECSYGSGGPLTYMGTEYIGFVLEWEFGETR